MTSEVEVGEYVVVLGEIVETHAEESILRAGTDVVDMDCARPALLHRRRP